MYSKEQILQVLTQPTPRNMYIYIPYYLLMDPISYYTSNSSKLETQISALKKRLFAFSMVRLSVFLSMAAVVYFFFGQMTIITMTLVVGFGVFFALVSKYTDMKNKLKYLNKLLSINKLEIKVKEGDLSELEIGNEYIFEEHHFNQDIDLFGDGSLFQIINRTATKNGKRHLAQVLNSNNIDDIEIKQEAIKEMAEKADWRQNYSATGSLIESDINSQEILNWVKSYKPYVPGMYKWLPIVFTLLSVGLFTAYSFSLIPGVYLLYWLIIGIGIAGSFIRKTTDLYNITSKINDTLVQYSRLLTAIENEEFQSSLLRTWKDSIQTQDVKASSHLNDLAKEINLLANRNNFVFGPIANGYMLWDLRYAFRIEKWLKEFDGAMEEWFTIIESFDAMNSLGNYAFNHPQYTFPSISRKEKEQLNAQNLGHPLLNAEAMVTNSINVDQEDFFIITGANMAGKSTFLRTVAVNLVMANCGLPVCAKEFSYQPIKLISSMRTSDSLMNDESYFFSELKRLKFIVEAIKTDTYFIILDEILKGTNSKDKAEGSQKFVEKLVASNSTGLIATHDLSLCTLADSLPQIRNYYFDAEIVDDELFFDYTFKKGICQNMNASFLLKKMEIV